MEFTVIVHLENDKNLCGAVSKLQIYTTIGLTTFASINCSKLQTGWVDPIATIHSDGESQEVNLLEYIAHNVSNVRTLRIVAALGGESKEQDWEQVDEVVKRLIDVATSMSNQLVIHDFRVAFPTYLGKCPNEPFFSKLADANLIVIARDSASHESIAMPIITDQTEEFASHIAVELSIAFGMWCEMDTSISQKLVGKKDMQFTKVFFISSRINILQCPPLPVAKVLSQNGEIPLPYQYVAVPDSNQASEKFSSLIYPPELRFSPSMKPVGPLISEEGKKFKWIYLKELLRAFLQTPSALLRGVQNQLDKMSGEALQEAIGGANSSVRILYPGAETGLGDIAVTEKQINMVISEIAERLDRPVISTIDEQTWLGIVDKVIAVADGGNAAAEIRTLYSNEKYLISRLDALGPEVEDLDSVLHNIYRGVQVPDVEFIGGLDLSPESGEVESGEVESGEVESGEVESGEVESGEVESGEVTNTPPEISLLERSSQVTQESYQYSNLLNRITGLILHEASTARNRASEMVMVLKQIPESFKATEVGSVSRAVQFAVAIGFSLFYLAMGSFTELRRIFSFGFADPKERSLYWALATTVIAFMAISGLFIRSVKKWQGLVIGAASALVVALGLQIVLWDKVWTALMRLKNFRAGPLAAGLLLIATLVLVAISITRNHFSQSRIRRQFANVLLIAAWCYALVGITAAIGSDNSRLWRSNNAWSGDLRSGVFKLLLSTSATLLIVSALVVAIVVVRERYKLEDLSRQLIWAVSELEESSDAERRLRMAAVQWVGTAAVIARLFRFPLGRILSDEGNSLGPGSMSKGVLKFDHQNLELTRKGELGLSARVRQLFIAKNWIGRQYRNLISKFQDDFAFEQGLTAGEDLVARPESCPSVPTFEQVCEGSSSGPRWMFLRNVFGGVYDSALLDTASELQLESAYSTIVADPESHSISNVDLIAPSYFQRLIPSEKVLLPTKLVTRLFSGADPAQLMSPHVWWPSELISNPGVNANVVFHSSSVISPEDVNEPIRLLGSCVLVSTPFLLSEVSGIDGVVQIEG